MWNLKKKEGYIYIYGILKFYLKIKCIKKPNSFAKLNNSSYLFTVLKRNAFYKIYLIEIQYLLPICTTGSLHAIGLCEAT